MKIIKIIKYLIFFIVLIIVISWVWFSYQINVRPSSDKTNIIFFINEGEGVNQISEKLSQQGLIKNKLAFETSIWLWGKENKIIAGRHNLNKNITIRQLTRIITTNPAYREVEIRIIEGWNSQKIASYLEEQGLFKAEEFLNYITATDAGLIENYPVLNDLPFGKSLEGYLHPDTYRVYYDATPANVVRKMLGNFEQKLTPDLREEIARQNKTFFEVITLASIVEKEVATEEDQKIVAGIFLKRLRDNYPLQSDATVNYITGKGLVQPSFDDTKIDHPYNTYKYVGLPPGPIANPGLASIMAVIYPNNTPYYYFLTTPDGQVIYSKTYGEHLVNKRKYLNL